MDIQILAFTVLSIILYAALVALSFKRTSEKSAVYKYLLTASGLSVVLLLPAIYISLFWSAFVCTLLIVIASYVGSQYGNKGALIKSGILGGIWLIIPWYLYLVSNT
ncbi:hypothetical protein [Colwellia sp. Bg11-12]|uniref:hypothetical protein n=1 Tax=Colwellia sp. Bg11-12 TaxID=2759817 RepID=UPI0015F368C9|nr:hypothetical protein [Colwellia sp. Bg11-12]MBA6265590.1 hypothetical protein [Colwellia sp. Bg11-12]